MTHADFAGFGADAEKGLTVIAHRGLWHDLPENSVEALLAAHAAGADFVEVDVRLAADDRFVCIHDDTLDRTTASSGPVRLPPSDVLSRLPLRASDGGEANPVTDCLLPDFETFSAAARGRVLLDIDVKDRRNFAAVVEAVREYDCAGFAAPKAKATTRADYFAMMELSARTEVQIKPVLTLAPALIEEHLSWLGAAPPLMVEVLTVSELILWRFLAGVAPMDINVHVNTLDTVPTAGCYDSGCARDPDTSWGWLHRMGVRMIQTDRVCALSRYRMAIGHKKSPTIAP